MDNVEKRLKRIFDVYAADSFPKNEMKGGEFFRLCQDTPGLLKDGVRKTDIAIVFTESRVDSNNLTFSTFLDALARLGEKMYSDVDAKTSFTLFLANQVFKNEVFSQDEDEEEKPPKWMPPIIDTAEPAKIPISKTGSLQSKTPPALPPSSPSKEPPPLPSKKNEISPRKEDSENHETSLFEAGFRIGPIDAKIRVGIYFDMTEATSKTLLDTLATTVLPCFEGKSVAFIFYNWISPWTTQSLPLAEMALACRWIAPNCYLDFCRKVMDYELSHGGNNYNRSKKKKHEELADIAAQIVGNKKAKKMLKLVRPHQQQNGLNRIFPAVKVCSLLSMQNSVRETPTFMINGLFDNTISHDWNVDEWEKHLQSFI
eukprot:g3000.t1